MDFDNLSLGDWIDIYEYLNSDCHLSEDGINKLKEMTARYHK